MAASLAGQLQRMCAHDIGATVRVLGALHGVGDPPQEAVDKAAHLVMALELWLHRLGAYPEAPRALFPTGAGIHEVAQRAELAGRAWAAYCEGLTEAECAREVAFTTTEGAARRAAVADILTHMSLHGQYHRGQVLTLLKGLLPAPVTTDFIRFVWGE